MFKYIAKAALLTATCAAAVLAGPTAYVINTTGETLSKINLTSGVVSNNILTLGSDIHCYPNQIKVRDTLAYVVLSGTHEIQIINLNTQMTAGWITLPGGSNPYWMDFLNDHYAYVSLLNNNSLAKIDLQTRQIIKETPVGLSPEGVLIYGGKAFVAVTGFDFSNFTWGQGKVAVYDLALDSVITSINVQKNPQYLDCDGSGKIHVACTGDYGSTAGNIFVIDPVSDLAIDSIAIGGQPGPIAVGPDNIAWIAAGGWAANGEVYNYNALTRTVIHGPASPVNSDLGASGVSIFQDTTVFVSCFANTVSRINALGATVADYSAGDDPISADFNYRPGDANGDWLVNVGDAVFLINFIFKGGTRPYFPAWRGNANGDGTINVGDAVYLINYIFKSGPAPQIGPTWIR
jgi:DNA-binding beta-propeller fold protein YncE